MRLWLKRGLVCSAFFMLMGSAVKNEDFSAVDYPKYLQERIHEIEAKDNKEKLNVLYILSEEMLEEHPSYEGFTPMAMARVDLDSKLCNSDSCLLSPRLSDDNIEVRVVGNKDEFFDAIEDYIGKIDVLYFFGHGKDFLGSSILYFSSNGYLLADDLAKINNDRKELIRNKFNEKSIGIFKSCKGLHEYETQYAIGEALSDFFGMPVIGSETDADSEYDIALITYIDGSKDVQIRPSVHIGKWRIVEPEDKK